MRLLLPLLLGLAAPARADDPVTAAEFEALVEGRTLTYGADGQVPYGIEHYFPDRRVTWAWLGSQECFSGEWYAKGPADHPAICFVYDYEPEVPKCWKFWQDGERLRAIFLNDGGGTMFYELAEEKGGLVCGGVGV